MCECRGKFKPAVTWRLSRERHIVNCNGLAKRYAVQIEIDLHTRRYWSNMLGIWCISWGAKWTVGANLGSIYQIGDGKETTTNQGRRSGVGVGSCGSKCPRTISDSLVRFWSQRGEASSQPFKALVTLSILTTETGLSRKHRQFRIQKVRATHSVSGTASENFWWNKHHSSSRRQY